MPDISFEELEPTLLGASDLEPAAGNEMFDDFLQTDLTQIYFNEISHHALLSRQEETELARLAKQNDRDARRKMIECNLQIEQAYLVPDHILLNTTHGVTPLRFQRSI